MSTIFTTLHNIYTTPPSFTQQKLFFPNIEIFTTSYQHFTQLYTTLQNFTRLHKTSQTHIRFNKPLQDFTQPLQHSTTLNKTLYASTIFFLQHLRDFTQLNKVFTKTLQRLTTLYKFYNTLTKLNKTSENFTTSCKTLHTLQHFTTLQYYT